MLTSPHTLRLYYTQHGYIITRLITIRYHTANTNSN